MKVRSKRSCTVGKRRWGGDVRGRCNRADGWMRGFGCCAFVWVRTSSLKKLLVEL